MEKVWKYRSHTCPPHYIPGYSMSAQDIHLHFSQASLLRSGKLSFAPHEQPRHTRFFVQITLALHLLVPVSVEARTRDVCRTNQP